MDFRTGEFIKMTNLSRALAYLDKLPNAISGSGGHNATLRAACECFRFGLSEGEAYEAMSWFNQNRCQPLWSEKDMRHKLADAQKIVGISGQVKASAGWTKQRRTFTPPVVTAKRNRDEHGPLPKPGVPIIDQSHEVEEAWWARTFAERGITDPAMEA